MKGIKSGNHVALDTVAKALLAGTDPGFIHKGTLDTLFVEWCKMPLAICKFQLTVFARPVELNGTGKGICRLAHNQSGLISFVFLYFYLKSLQCLF